MRGRGPIETIAVQGVVATGMLYSLQPASPAIAGCVSPLP